MAKQERHDPNFGVGKFVDGVSPSDATYTGGNVGVGLDDPADSLEVSQSISARNSVGATLRVAKATNFSDNTANPALELGDSTSSLSLGVSMAANTGTNYTSGPSSVLLPYKCQLLTPNTSSTAWTNPLTFWNGKVGINTGGAVEPTATMQIGGNLRVGSYTLPEVDGTADQVLKTDGAGVVTWQDAVSGPPPLVATAYNNASKVGAWTISVSNSAGLFYYTYNNVNVLINGNLSEIGLLFGYGNTAGYWIEFDLGAAYQVDALKISMLGASPQGTWKLQGFDGSGWVDMTASFIWGSATTQEVYTLSGSSQFQRIRMAGVSGTRGPTGWLAELNFKIGN